MGEDSSTTFETTTVEQTGDDRPYDIQEAREKIGTIFRYLQELHRIRTPPVVSVANYDWSFLLESLPHHPAIHRGELFGNLGFLRGEDQPSGRHIVKVGRPKETECPQPSVMIENWLKPGWDQVGSEPLTYAKRRIKTTSDDPVTEKFEDSQERVDAFEDWLELWKEWEETESGVVDALTVFSNLFELWGRIKRESEKYQLFLGDGMLVMDHASGKIRHPLLLQRVQLKFNALVPEFVIQETSEGPEIYSPLLRYLGVDGQALAHAKEVIAEEQMHPLGGKETSEFLKDLVQRCWEDGQYFEYGNQVDNPTGPCVYRQPLLYLGNRNQGFADAIERYVERLPNYTELPESLLRIVGIDTGRGAAAEGDHSNVDLLLTKDANPEQKRVIRRLEETGAVLVQGPPGTGKSHTIANLIGHLLAQQKSILVTSHASKALRVVREKVATPLQSLCVSLLDSDDESMKQLEESITGIVNYLSTSSEKKLQKQIEKLAEKRNALKREHDDLRGQLVSAIATEFRDIEVLHEGVSPAVAARRIAAFRGKNDWIPGPVSSPEGLPFEPGEVKELYSLVPKVTEEDEKMLRAPLPEPERLPDPKTFADLFDEATRLEKMNLKVGAEYWIHDKQNLEILGELLDAVTAAASIFDGGEKWVLECLDAGQKGGQDREAWMVLVRTIEKCLTEIPDKEALILEHGPKIRSNKPTKELIGVCSEIVEHLKAGKRLGRLPGMMKAEWKEFIQIAQVDEGAPSKQTHFQAVLNLLEVRALRDDLSRRWDYQMESLEAPDSAELGRKPEKGAKPFADSFRRALDWHEGVWTPLERAFDRAGFDLPRLVRNTPARQGAYRDVLLLRDLLTNQLKPILENRKDYLRLAELRQMAEEWLEYLDGFSRNEGSYPLVKLFTHGVRRKNFDSYSNAWKRLHELLELRSVLERRDQLLAKIEPVAPAWAEEIRERRSPHTEGKVPGDVFKAWKHRHWEQILEEQHKTDLESLQEKVNAVTQELQNVTASYVEKLAWAAQQKRTGLKQQQALNGWLALHKKMGRGTGKNVPRLKEAAKKTLVECRSAVPVWIMPLSRVVESFDIATTSFDVVILDEASQNDVLGLVVFALGKEVVVVGDHEQVSPYAVGHQTDKIHELIDELLQGIPNRQLYDGKTSVYDLARQSFGGVIRLLEHFRCVPDIIQFSNQLCYNGEIRPLREASASQVVPHLISHRVRGGVSINKVNEREAAEVASLVSAICRLPEYEKCTIGVISMVGIDQALYIDAILRTRLTATEYQRRRVLCGNASQFQGDERDIIFLSMVDSPAEGKQLTLRQREDVRKVFNVAASRARDQLWVVHSLDPNRDLKPGDLRLRLISHAENPGILRKPPIEKQKKQFASEFEKRVYQGLEEAGFQTALHFEVGEFELDIVVEGTDGRRVAILCDGDREAPEETIQGMERQLTLERLGWIFVRLRASEFFRAPDKVFNKLLRRLKYLGIDRAARQTARTRKKKEAAAERGDDLVEKVVRRAESIRTRWRNIPAVPTRRPSSRADDEEEGEETDEDEVNEENEDVVESENA